MERVVPELQVDMPSVDEERRPDARAERDHQLGAPAFDDSESLDIRVVGHPGGAVQQSREPLAQPEADPRRVEVGRALDRPLVHDAGKADGDAIEIAEARRQVGDHPQYPRGCRRLRRLLTHALADRSAAPIEPHGLDPRPTDIDRQSHRISRRAHGRRLVIRGGRG